MKVCVIGGTNPATNGKWLSFAPRLGELLCNHDYEMVWGGNGFGVLSHIHKEYIKAGKANTLFLPRAYQDDLKKMTTDKVVSTELVVERTHQMFLSADAIICVPGGIGTIYEFWTAIEGKRAGEYDIDIILLNHENFYKHTLAHFDFINENGFTKIGQGGAPYKIEPTELFMIANTPEQVIAHLEQIKYRRSVQPNA